MALVILVVAILVIIITFISANFADKIGELLINVGKKIWGNEKKEKKKND